MAKTSRKLTIRRRKVDDPKPARLPNAPLVEVVFELRWELHAGESLPPGLRTDPLVLPLLNTFTAAAERLGFTARQDMAKPEEVVGHNVLRRFRRGQDLAFPLLQIGSGVFAANEGPLYEWPKFKANVLSGVAALVKSYPIVPSLPFVPMYLELRYVDAFDQSVTRAPEILSFLSSHTSMRLAAPDFMDDRSLFAEETDARVALQKNLKGWPNSKFIVEIASATNSKTKSRAIQMQTKVITQKPGMDTASDAFEKQISGWLDFAHGLTSPFFKSFVSKELMAQFEEPSE